MRDGEQSPGASMTRDEKLRIARALERMRVDVIEAGFPASSNGDFEAVRAIANVVKDSTVCGPVPRERQRHPARHRRAEGREGVAHPYLHRHQPAAHGEEAAHDARAGARAGEASGALCAATRCPDVEFSPGGRLALRARLPLPRARGGDQGGRDHDQHPGHGRLRGAAAVRRVHPQPAREDSELGQGGVVACTATTTSAWRSPTRSPRCRSAARARSSARSTAWASAPATPRSRRSSWR